MYNRQNDVRDTNRNYQAQLAQILMDDNSVIEDAVGICVENGWSGVESTILKHTLNTPRSRSIGYEDS